MRVLSDKSDEILVHTILVLPNYVVWSRCVDIVNLHRQYRLNLQEKSLLDLREYLSNRQWQM